MKTQAAWITRNTCATTTPCETSLKNRLCAATPEENFNDAQPATPERAISNVEVKAQPFSRAPCAQRNAAVTEAAASTTAPTAPSSANEQQEAGGNFIAQTADAQSDTRKARVRRRRPSRASESKRRRHSSGSRCAGGQCASNARKARISASRSSRASESKRRRSSGGRCAGS